MGLSTCSRTKIAPANASGPASEVPRCTAPTSTPIAIAKAPGRIPLNRSATHQAVASPGLAFARAAKSFHSLRSVSVWSTRVFCHKPAHTVASPIRECRITRRSKKRWAASWPPIDNVQLLVHSQGEGGGVSEAGRRSVHSYCGRALRSARSRNWGVLATAADGHQHNHQREGAQNHSFLAALLARSKHYYTNQSHAGESQPGSVDRPWTLQSRGCARRGGDGQNNIRRQGAWRYRVRRKRAG